jgi:hypothetical protein
VITALPADTPVTKPRDVTVAILVLLLAQEMATPVSSVPLPSFALAVN